MFVERQILHYVYPNYVYPNYVYLHYVYPNYVYLHYVYLHYVCGAANPALCFVYCLHYVSVLTIRHDHKQHDKCPPPTADNCPPPTDNTNNFNNFPLHANTHTHTHTHTHTNKLRHNLYMHIPLSNY